MTLILEIAAGIVLGVLALIALGLSSVAFSQWLNDFRWGRLDKKYRSKVRQLSRRYSRHLLKEAGINLPLWTDALGVYMPIDEGESKFDPRAAAEIERIAHRADALR